MIINTAVKLKDSKIARFFCGVPQFYSCQEFHLRIYAKLNCEYKIPCAKMKILVLLISMRLCIRKAGFYKRINFFLRYFFQKYLVIYQFPIQSKLGVFEIFH